MKRRHLLPLLLLALFASCSVCKSDRERAEAERKEMKEKYEKSFALAPYRVFKIMIRSKDEPNEPEAVKELNALLEEASRAAEVKDGENAKATAETMARLIKGMYLARKTLNEHDEDDFPLVMTKYGGPNAAKAIQGYDANMEHLFFGVVWWVIQAADKGGRLPSLEIIQYELSRAAPNPGWPWGISQATYWLRGASFCSGKYHYAADEELTAFIDNVEHATPEQVAELKSKDLTGEQVRQQMLATGYFTRAWNRYGLKREDAAVADIEQGLKALEKVGIENELTWWGWTLVYVHQKKYPEAAAKLDKLAASPFIEEANRKELKEAADALRSNTSFPLIGETKAMVLVGKAVIARAGGIEKLLSDVLGTEVAAKVMKPLRVTQQLQEGLTSFNAEQAGSLAKGAAEKGLSLGKKGLEALKSMSQQDAGSP